MKSMICLLVETKLASSVLNLQEKASNLYKDCGHVI